MGYQKEPFDRSECFFFYKSYANQIELVEKYYGVKMAYNVISALADYALYEKEIEDPMIRLLVGYVTLDFIDTSQYTREKRYYMKGKRSCYEQDIF